MSAISFRPGNIFLKTMYIYQYQKHKCKKCDYAENDIEPLSIYGLSDTQDTAEAD
jgi:hypothetical protein